MPHDATTLFSHDSSGTPPPHIAPPHSTASSQEASSADALWAQCLDIIRDNINHQVFRTWFANIRALSWNGSKLLIQVPSQFYYEWIEEHYGALMRTVIAQILGPHAELQYEVIIDKSEDITLEDRTIRLPAMRQQPVGQPSFAQVGLPFAQQQSIPQNFPTYLNPNYVFENFIRGESNQLAAAAAIAIAENPGKTKYNPLVIYGSTGLGKTHLVHALGNRALQLHRNIRVFYTNSERFTMEYINAIQSGKVNEFTNFYRSVDILIVDDIQFFSGKEKTQDNFFHTFNALHQSGKQIILTSDKPPKEIQGVDERLISRFQWGLTADIQPPDYEMRLAILQRKAADEGAELPVDVMEYLARNITSSVRELEGCLISLLAKVSLDGRELTLDLAREVVKGIATEQPPKEVSVKTVLQAVSEYYDISPALITGKTRKQEVVLARQMAMYLLKQYTQLSLKSIGMHFGGRDHTTVIHSCTMVKNYLETDTRTQAALIAILQKLGLPHS
ncbi:MAG: chromosomal replication initiator protein DnaA [Bacteroidota bacterium]|nr:chromosomal replication initiator protein DnaA [Candidatus Kapabacteria bacterium]MDW8219768.1 chromosomal replication initiator protein DnaA [Bacteroidota bacterium]